MNLRAYKEGRKSAFRGDRKAANPHSRALDIMSRHSWFAGWHDFQMENDTGIYE